MKFTIQPVDQNATFITKTTLETLTTLKEVKASNDEVHIETNRPLIGHVVYKHIRCPFPVPTGSQPQGFRGKLALAANEPNDAYNIDGNIFLPCGNDYYLVLGEQTVFYATDEHEFELKLI